MKKSIYCCLMVALVCIAYSVGFAQKTLSVSTNNLSKDTLVTKNRMLGFSTQQGNQEISNLKVVLDSANDPQVNALWQQSKTYDLIANIFLYGGLVGETIAELSNLNIKQTNEGLKKQNRARLTALSVALGWIPFQILSRNKQLQAVRRYNTLVKQTYGFSFQLLPEQKAMTVGLGIRF